MEKENNEAGRGILWESLEDGTRRILLPDFQYAELDRVAGEQRFLLLHPVSSEEVDTKHVSCDLLTMPLKDAPPFIAVDNARGYRLLQEVIEVNGQALGISAALQMFLRHFRTWIAESTWIWVRYISLQEFDKTEQAHFWNREWCNKMHSLATEVVDMHLFNATLLEEGKCQRVYDSRYMSWTKEWYGAPDQMIAPAVYPCVLGQKFSNEAPTCDFKYVPLDLITDEVRILVLNASGPDPNSPIVMHMGHCPNKCEVTYEALSHRWGDPSVAAQIVLNGQKKLISQKLYDTLLCMRDKNSARILWIDAICINQDDILEKGHQIGRMGKIFDCAVSVKSFLTISAEDSELASELIDKLHTPMVRFNNAKGEWHLGDWNMGKNNTGIVYGDNPITPAKLARMCAALYKMVTQDYFKRAWIVQEIAVAANPCLLLSTGSLLDYDKLDKALQNMLDMLRRDPILPGQIMEVDSTIEVVDKRLLSSARKLFWFRHLHSQGANVSLIFRGMIKVQRPDFLEALILTREFDSTDPRDKIYAMWDLARDQDDIKFSSDYTKTADRTFLDFSLAWIDCYRSLEIIAAAENPIVESAVESTLPSWCPDWSKHPLASNLLRHEHVPTQIMAYTDSQGGPIYSANGLFDLPAFESAHSPLFTIHDNEIHCAALIFDTIDTILPPAPEEYPEGTLVSRNCYDGIAYLAAKSAHAAIVSHYDTNPTIPPLYHTLSPVPHPSSPATSLTTPYSPIAQLAFATLHGDVPSVWPLKSASTTTDNDNESDGEPTNPPSNPDSDSTPSSSTNPPPKPVPDHVREQIRSQFAWERPYTFDSTSSRRVKPYAGGYREEEAWEAVANVMRGRRAFVSREGWMGLMPKFAIPNHTSKAGRGSGEVEGDEFEEELVLAILASCTVPVVLRRRKVDGSYFLAGTAFVQGWMEAEALRDMAGEKDVSEFWALIGEGEKIVIR